MSDFQEVINDETTGKSDRFKLFKMVYFQYKNFSMLFECRPTPTKSSKLYDDVIKIVVLSAIMLIMGQFFLYTETKKHIFFEILVHTSCFQYFCLNKILHYRALLYRVIFPFYNNTLHFLDTTTTGNRKVIFETMFSLTKLQAI